VLLENKNLTCNSEKKKNRLENPSLSGCTAYSTVLSEQQRVEFSMITITVENHLYENQHTYSTQEPMVHMSVSFMYRSTKVRLVREICISIPVNGRFIDL
jgi:hypothetical protein